jgi:hypothetical protein
MRREPGHDEVAVLDEAVEEDPAPGLSVLGGNPRLLVLGGDRRRPDRLVALHDGLLHG